MKQKLLLCCVFVLTAFVSGQSQPGPEMGERLKSMHAAYITDRLRLTPEEAQSFWPLYNEFQDKERAIKEIYKPEVRPGQMSEEEANRQIDRHLQMEQEILDLKVDYFQRLRTVIPARKLALLHAAEREFKERLIQEMQKRRQERMGGRRPRN